MLTLCKDSPAFPGALSDPWTCPGPWPPLFAVIRAMKRICCSWGRGPRQALPSTSTSRGRGSFSQPDPAKRVWEIQDHLQDSDWLPLPEDPSSTPIIPPVSPPQGAEAILFLSCIFCFPMPAVASEDPPVRRDLKGALRDSCSNSSAFCSSLGTGSHATQTGLKPSV